jgi:hypothetical protein
MLRAKVNNMTSDELLKRVRVASRCKAEWNAMEGDDRSRICRACSKFVYDFSALTSAEVEALVRAKEGRLCARLYRRRDGRMLTADCPVGAKRRRNLAALVAAGLGLVMASASGALGPFGHAVRRAGAVGLVLYGAALLLTSPR